MYNISKTYRLIILFLLFPTFVFSQLTKLDSLRNEIKKNPKPDTMRIKAISWYLKEAFNNNSSDLLPTIKEFTALSKKNKYKKGIIKGYLAFQIYYHDRGDFKNALKYTDSAKVVLNADTTLNARLEIGRVFNNEGNCYFKLGDYNKALESYFKSLKIFEPLNNVFVSTIYSNIGMVYTELEDLNKRIFYDEKALKFAEKYGNDYSLSLALINGAVGQIMIKNFKLASKYKDRIYPILLKTDNYSHWYNYYLTKAQIESEEKKSLNAIKSFQKSIYFAHENEDPYQLSDAFYGLEIEFFKTNRIENAKIYLDSLLDLSQENNFKAFKKLAYQGLSKYYNLKGNVILENKYLNMFISINDSINSENIKKQGSIVEAKYQTEKKDAQIILQETQLKQKTTNNILLIGGIIGFALLSLLVFINYRNRLRIEKQQVLQLRQAQQLTATESILKGQEEERGRLARDLHDGLGGLLSGLKLSLGNLSGNQVLSEPNAKVFEGALGQLDTAISEMRRVAHSMMPEALLRFGLVDAVRDFSENISQTGKLKIHFQTVGLSQERFPENVEITLYRIIQELVNNTLKHAKATDLYLQLAKTDDLLTLTAEDNGKGFETHTLKEGIGLKNIKNRVDYLGGKLDIRSKIGEGTSFLIEINA